MSEEKNISLIKLIHESLLALFLWCVTSKDEYKSHNIKEKWIIWFRQTFSKESMFNFIQGPCYKILKVFAVFIIFFIVINIFIFTPIVTQQLESDRYPVARAYTTSAFYINKLYIIPLSRVFGYGNPLTWGLYPIKDYLYNKGVSAFPENEGEREIWWFNVRFAEFKAIVEPTLSDSFTYNVKQYKKLPKWQEKNFKKWNEELYQHIQVFPKANITDPKYKKEKLIRFLDIASTYRRTSSILYTKLEITKKEYNPEEHDVLPYPDAFLANRYVEIIEIFNKLKEYSSQYEKDSYDYFNENKRYKEEKFLYDFAYYVVASKVQDENIDCNDPIVKTLADNHTKLRNYYEKAKEQRKQNKKRSLGYGEDMNLQMTISGGIPGFTFKKCTNHKLLKEYNEYFINKARSLGLTDKGEQK